MDELLKQWQHHYDSMQDHTAEIRNEIAGLQDYLTAMESSYREAMAELEAQIRPLAVERGRTYSHNGVTVNYRKGSHRVTYDWRRVDSVQRVLRDIVPSTAEELAEARKETVGKPSVRIVRTVT